MKKNRPNPELRFTKMVGKRVAKYRKRLQLTQQQLAEKAGCGLYRQLIGRLENGEQMPTAFQLRALAEALTVPLSCLLDQPFQPEPLKAKQAQRLSSQVQVPVS